MVVQAMKQETFTDIEYSCRKKKTKREEFLEIMDEIIPLGRVGQRHQTLLSHGKARTSAHGH